MDRIAGPINLIDWQGSIYVEKHPSYDNFDDGNHDHR